MSDWPPEAETPEGETDGTAGAAVDLARMRLEYETAGMEPADLATDPIEQFDRWLAAAVEAGVYEPNAMVVSTVDGDGQPWSRNVLLKGAGPAGFDFYTNYRSHKSTQLDANPRAAATFSWLPLHRQVNVAGVVERVPEPESDAYWAVRVRGSQLGAWASDQSAEVADRRALTEQYRAAEERFPGDVPRPGHWGGWRLVPHTVEFWQGRRNRLHDRVRYRRSAAGTAAHGREGSAERWDLVRLSP